MVQRDHVILPNTVKVTFNLKLNQQIKHVVNNVGRALIKKNVLMIGSKEIDTINNSDICDTYKNFYLSQKEGQEKLLRTINSNNGLKVRIGSTSRDSTEITKKDNRKCP